jgi:transcription initiation factor TFIIB
MDFIKLCSHVIKTFLNLRISEGHHSEKQPASVAAAAIYVSAVVKEWHKDKASLFRISEVSGMAEVTIRTSFYDMVPYASKLLPSANQDRLADLLAEAERMRAGSTMMLPSHASKRNLVAAGADVPLLKLDEVDVPIDVPGDVKIEVKEEIGT